MTSRLLLRWIVTPTAGFTLGCACFLRPWPPTKDERLGTVTLKRPLEQQRHDVLAQIQNDPEYSALVANGDVHHFSQSEKIPHAHRDYHVGQGLLYGKGHLEIDPLLFHDLNTRELVVFYHLGHNLGNERGNVHKGIVALLMDEALCYCGFPTLPSKRGVTARLDLTFAHDVPADSTVVLRARVRETKGRKCVIDGTLESLPATRPWYNPWGPTKRTQIASGTCILVEPKWFKHMSWFSAF
ncbi:LAMI_0D04676g1_1 [Lachancea mirantina]|uniref:LAMI_0D04676g1_1 n=1 Tax=Lachancea mirantina TaxID=1230905 RepID=A0A1G4JAK9_9SACH|nr:LAMI_0D04676g1_1 [Lachancea mirantina]